MTTIDKLLIQGIRSFSPQNRNIIEFYQPLTLIVGPNGAGKTTIIECLKYCTTGNMPPGSHSGQAFVHDPKVAGEREVKAQIKLRFRNVNGKPIVCTRSLQCTQRATSKVCKTLESALQTYNSANEKVSQSFRCADLDREIPELIGVSKPILENVIFCHQEESNWPLSEGSTLKKKFDDIFAATRYTKALEAIKKQRKEQAQSIRELKIRLENLQNQKDMAHKIRRELETKQGFLASAEEQMTELKAQIEGLEKSSADLKRKTNAISALMNELSNLRAVHEQMNIEKNKTYDDLQEEFEETDEELFQLAASFNKDLAEKEKAAAEIQEKLSTLSKNKEKHEGLLLSLKESSGSIKATMERQRGIQTERDEAIIAFAKRYRIPGYEKAPFSQEQVNAFLQQSRVILQGLKQKIEELKGEHAAKSKEITAEIEKRHAEMSSWATQIKQKSALLESNKRKLAAMEAEIKQKQAMYSKLSELEAGVEKQEQDLVAMRKALNLDEINEQIERLRNEKKILDSEVFALSNKMKVLSLQASSRARLSVKKADAQKKEEAYKASYEQKKAELDELFGPVPLDKIKGELTMALNKKKREVATTRSRLQDLKMSSSALIGEQKSIQNQLKQLEEQLEEKNTALKQLEAVDRPLPDLISEAEEKIQAIKSEMAMIEAAERMYANYIEKAQHDEECPLCERSFQGGALKEFITRLQELVSKVPGSLKANETLLVEREVLHQQLVELRPVWMDHVRLQEQEIPAVKKRLEGFEEKKAQLDVEINQLQEALSEFQRGEQNLMNLLGDMDGILRTYNEFLSLKREVSAEEQKLSLSSSDTRSLEDVEKEYSEKQRRSEEWRVQIDSLSKDVGDKQSQILRQEGALNKLKAQLLETRGASAAVVNIQASFAELTSANEVLVNEIKEAESNLGKATELKDRQVREREELGKQFESNSEAVQKEREVFQQLLSQVENLEKQMGGKSPEALTAELEKVEARKSEIQKKLESMASSEKEATETLNSLREMLAASSLHKRNIDDNIKYRKQKAGMLRVETEMRAKEDQIKSENAESIEFDLSKINKTIEKGKQELNQMIGKRDIYGRQIKDHTMELKKPIYKNIDEDFRELLIKVKTSEMANCDLEKYYVALDKALMKYHSVKMTEINKIIKELWQRTYKGQDIETIEIRSDPETTGKGRSSYNYRVVMVKGDSELDMRGRCSAGQKVLASLIIRLALAETFCLNCGILALDEPTTNLDRLNVESFANSLVSIITSRKQQRNFQLIIITHDEEFVQLLGRSEHADYYWRVSKDINGHSIIERQDIQELA